MSRSLNKTRMRDTRILMLLTLFTGVFCKTMFPDETLAHETLDFTGYLLVAACVVGRIYTTAFIGGSKNTQLITWGPYSFCRNPLYFFSLLGAAGIGLMSTSLLAFSIIFFGFLAIYLQLIAREEELLQAKFGQAFEDYKERVNKLLPSMRNYNCPAELTFKTLELTHAVRDGVWWFAALPIFEIAEMLQEQHIINPLMQVF